MLVVVVVGVVVVVVVVEVEAGVGSVQMLVDVSDTFRIDSVVASRLNGSVTSSPIV